MQLRWTLAAVTLAAAAIAAPAQAADPVADLLVQADARAYRAVVTADEALAGLDRFIVLDPPPPPPTPVRVFGTADAVTITDWGHGPQVSYGGVLKTLWDCSMTHHVGASVVVTCQPKANTNIAWSCGVLNLSAKVFSRAVDVYEHGRDTVQQALAPARRPAVGPSVPDPRPRQWGQAAGFVSCDGDTLETAQADRDNPFRQTAKTMGAVTTLTCEARRSPGSATTPVAPYSVTCIDPVDPASLL